MELSSLLEISPGVTAVIGGGGKTTLLWTLGQELSGNGHCVLLYTTTKILPVPDIPCAKSLAELEELRERHRLLCAGTMLPETGKLTAMDAPMERLASGFDYVLVEADGAARRPLKAHAAHEPVIPPEANQTICVVGASGFGRSISEVAHRPDRYALLAGVRADDAATPETEAAVLKAEALHDRVYINQAETASRMADARALAALLDCPALAGSLQKGECVSCSL